MQIDADIGYSRLEAAGALLFLTIKSENVVHIALLDQSMICLTMSAS